MNSALKGHAMKRGTLMVLKRLLVTALSALGLGALVSGTAFAQQIPVPDIFDDQIACSMNVPSAMDTPMPTVVPMDGMSTLATLIGMGTVVIDTSATGAGTYEDLGYVIPATNTNCGMGTADGATPFVTTGAGAVSDVTFDVADGYTKLLPLFTAVYGDPGLTTGGTSRALAAARKALADQIEDGTTGTALNPYEAAVDRALDAHNKALATFNAAAGGPIYQAGVAEWMAKAAVTKAVEDYNTQVTATNTALTALDAMSYASYVPLGNNELVGTVVTFDGEGNPTVVLSQLNQYINADLSNPQVAVVAMDGSTTSTNSNFDATGKLVVPMSLQDHDSDSDTDNILAPVVVADGTANVIGGTGGIRTRVEQFNAAAEAIKKLRDDNVNPVLQPIFDQAYIRAQAEADYYNAEWAEVQADNTDTRTADQKLRHEDTDGSGVIEPDEAVATNLNADYIPNVVSIASRNAAYTTESNKRFSQEQGLRAAVATRESATAAVRAQFTDGQSFYSQLVARRQALKAAADKLVADASKDGATPPMNLVDSAKAAQDSLAAAQKAQATIHALFDDPSDPTVDLINELLLADGDGDDGQGLVDAISETYDETMENAERLDALLTTDADGTESGRIVSIEESIEGLTGGGDGAVDQLRTDLNALAGDGRMDETVAGNADDIETLDMEVSGNSQDLDAVWEDLDLGQRGTDEQHGDMAVCDPASTSTAGRLACAEALAEHNEADIDGLMGDEGAIATGDAATLKSANEAAMAGDAATLKSTNEAAMAGDAATLKSANEAAMAGDAATLKSANEAAMAGDAATLKSANEAAMAGDAATLKSANEAAMAGDAATLKSANEAAMAGDAATLKSANEAAMAGDAATLKSANEAAMAGDAATLKSANEAAMAGDAATLKSANEAAMAGDAATLKSANEAAMAGDAATLKSANEAAMAGDAAEAKMRADADMMLAGHIDSEAMARADADMMLAGQIDSEAMARMDADMMLGGMIDSEAMARMDADTALGGRITSNAGAIASNMNAIGSNASAISDNRNMIGELSDDLDVVRAGVAASMALAGMPAINGRGIAIGVGSFDGESAFAVGFQIQGEQASFKVGVTSGGGATGASAGVGFNF